MSLLSAWQIALNAGNQTIFSQVGITVPGAGAIDVPHGLLVDQPPGGPYNLPILVAVHPLTVNNGIVQIGVSLVNGTIIRLTNAGGLADDVKVQAVAFPHWLGYEGTVYPPIKNFHAEAIAVLAAGGATPVGPCALDDGQAAVLLPRQSGLCPEVATAGNWGWMDNPEINAPVVTNDDPANALDFRVGCQNYASQQRVTTDPPGPLLAESPEITIPPNTQADFPHGLQENGAAVIPDLAWFVPTGGPAAGVALAAPVNLYLVAMTNATYSVANRNLVPGEDVTGKFYAMYDWSAGRV